MGRHRVAHARTRACAGGPRFARRLGATDAPCPFLALHAFRMGVQTRHPQVGVEGPDAHGACAGSQRLAPDVARQPRGRVGLGLDVGGGTRAWQRPHPLGPRGRRTVGGGLCSGRPVRRDSSSLAQRHGCRPMRRCGTRHGQRGGSQPCGPGQNGGPQLDGLGHGPNPI